MKVYIAIEDLYINFQILGCFSTREKAEAYIKSLGKPADIFKIEETDLQ